MSRKTRVQISKKRRATLQWKTEINICTSFATFFRWHNKKTENFNHEKLPVICLLAALCAVRVYGHKMAGIRPLTATRIFDRHGSFQYIIVHTTKDTTMIISTSEELNLK